MIRALVVVGVVAVSAPAAAQPVRACDPKFVGDLLGPPSVDLVSIDNAADPLAIPRHFLVEPLGYYAYGVGSGRARLAFVPIWKPGEDALPVAIVLPKRDGFIDADRQTMRLFEALKGEIGKLTRLRLVDSQLQSVVWLDVNSIGAASTERNSAALAHVTIRTKMLQPGCVMSPFTGFDGKTTQLAEAVIYMVKQTHQKEIRQLCERTESCAAQIAEDVMFWIDTNFKLPPARK